MDRSLSPVSGGSFKRKKKDGERSILFEEGDLRDSIISKNRAGDEIEVGVFDSTEKKIAYNHNIGDTVPIRQFIPGEDQSFKKKITNRVDRRIKEIKRGRESTAIRDLETTTLGQIFEQLTSSSSGQTQSEPALSLTIGGLLDFLDG